MYVLFRSLFLAASLSWFAFDGRAEEGGHCRLYAAPAALGGGDGSVREHAADFRSMKFWNGINAKLAEAPVTVTLLAGRYVISEDPRRKLPALQLSGLGHDRNPLVIEGEHAGAVIFTRHASDKKIVDYPKAERPNLKGPGFFFLTASRNATVRNLNFTARDVPIGYATNFAGGRNVTIENCHWYDLQGVYFGATGTTGAATDHVTFRNCRFERVGSGGHAHMIYNAYDPLHLRLVGCHFEDCAGDYVRFRDGTDYAVVTDCTFRSTGKYIGVHMPFIAIPLFNDDNPAAPKSTPNYEYFGTHFLFCHNRFIYETDEKPDTRVAVVFHHSGFDPPGRRHLLNPAEAAILRHGSAAQKRDLVRRNLGIDLAAVHVFGNESVGVAHAGIYRCHAAYGAKPRGGEGLFAIGDLFNADPVVDSPARALDYFGDRTDRVK
jgi:hypothetical protein